MASSNLHSTIPVDTESFTPTPLDTGTSGGVGNVSSSGATVEEAPPQPDYSYRPPRVVFERLENGPYIVQFDPARESGQQGGFGSVYKVVSKSGRYAVKCPTNPRSLRVLESVVWELEVFARLGNGSPHIVPIVYMEADGDVPLLMIPWAEHGSLHSWMCKEARPLYTGSDREVACRLLHILVQISGGVAYAHSRGITHADLKPGNILVMDTEAAAVLGVADPVTRLNVQVCDFGISGGASSAQLSRDAEADLAVEAPENLLGASAETVSDLRDVRSAGRGTRGYASPEQCRFIDAPVLSASDVWSFGILMRELLSRGHWSHRSLTECIDRSKVDLMLSHIHEELSAELDWLREVDGSPDVYAELTGLVKVCLKFDPSERMAMDGIHSTLVDILAALAPGWYHRGPDRIDESVKITVYDSYAKWYQYIRKDADRAQEMYMRAIDADPVNVQSLCNYAIFMYDVRRDMDSAHALYGRAIEANPEHAPTLYSYALFMQNMRGDIDRAQELYERAIAAEPEHVPSLNNCAFILTNVRRDMGRARELYERAIAVDPWHVQSLRSYAAFMKNVHGDMDKAQELYERAIEADPGNVQSLISYANFMQTVRGDMDKAEELYEKAIAADPGHEPSRLGYAVFKMMVRGDTDRAREQCERAIEADPRHVPSLNQYAVFMQIVRGDMDRAEELFERAIAADPRHVPSLYQYALFMQNVRGDMNKAEDLYKKAIEADPGHEPSLRSYANFMQNVRGDMGRAQAPSETAGP